MCCLLLSSSHCDAVEWSACAAPLLTAKLVGKRKHGSASVDRHTAVCTMHTSDGQRFVIRAAVRGRLIEVNSKLMVEAGSDILLEADNEWSGYVCIVLMDKPQLYDLIDNTDSRYATAEAWKEMLSDTTGGAGSANVG